MFVNPGLTIPSFYPAIHPSSSDLKYEIVVLWGTVVLDCLQTSNL